MLIAASFNINGTHKLDTFGSHIEMMMEELQLPCFVMNCEIEYQIF